MAAHLGSRIDENGVQQLFDTSHSLEPRAVGIQVAVMTVLSILTILTFNILRPRHKTIYEPKVKYHVADKRPPRISESFCGWISPLFHNHEPELLDRNGLDAVAFLRFLHLLRWLFTLTALVACGGLIPLDFLYTLSIKPPQYDFLSAMTIQYIHGIRLYAHIGSTYLITFFLMSLVHHHWRAMYRLRNEWFRSPEYQRLFYARTMSITHIPPKLRSDAGLYKIFAGMHLPYPITSVHIGRRVGALPELIQQHDDAVEELEEVVARYTKGDQTLTQRPSIVVGGFCGLGGTRKDAIKYYTSKIKHTEAAVQQYRAQLDMQQAENYGFATMTSIPSAHAAARDLKGEHPKGLTFKLAPNPKDIIWKNLGLSRGNRRFRRITGFIMLQLICLLSLVPLFPVASLANLDALAASGYIPFLKTWSTTSPITYTVVSGVLPPAIASVFGYFVPRLMRWLSKYMGATTHSGLDRIVIARYFAFLTISQLIIFTILGVIFNSVVEIIDTIQTQGASLKTVFDHLDKLPARITQTYVDQSSFWLKWFPMQGFLIIFDLAELFDLIWLSLRTRLYGRTPRHIREYTKPPVFDYAIDYCSLLFMAAVGLLFAPLAPLVSLAAAIVFWLSSWVYKYQLMFVFVTRVETGGRSWNVVINRILFAGMFMQVIMILTIALQAQFESLQFIASIPPLLALLLFKYYLNKRFASDFQYYIPRFEELSRSIVYSEDSDIGGNKLEQRYTHPALHTELFTPMIHSRVVPMLRRIYKGKTSHPDRVRSRGIEKQLEKGKGLNDEAVMEGVVFTPVHVDQLDYDPELYRRDREEVDRDFDSVTLTSSADRHSYEPPPQLHHDDPRLDSTQRRGVGYETEHPPPTLDDEDVVGSLHKSPTYRRHDRWPSPSSSSAAPSYQTTDTHVLSHETNAPRVTHDHQRPSQSNRVYQPIHTALHDATHDAHLPRDYRRTRQPSMDPHRGQDTDERQTPHADRRRQRSRNLETIVRRS